MLEATLELLLKASLFGHVNSTQKMKVFLALLLPLLTDATANFTDIMRLFSQQNRHFDWIHFIDSVTLS